MQEIFGAGPCLLDACNATDLSDLFVADAIPEGIPEPATLSLLGFGVIGMLGVRRSFRLDRYPNGRATA